MSERRPRRLAGWALAAVVLTVVVLPLPEAAAQSEERPSGVLGLRWQTTWWSPGQPFSMGLAVQTTRVDDLAIAVTVHRPVGSRSEFAQALEGRVPRRQVHEIPPAPLVDLPLDAAGDRTLTLSPGMTAEGVYPVRVELRPVVGGQPVDSLTTFLIHAVAPTEGDPLAVAWIVPLHAPPAVQPDGRVAIDDERAEELSELARSLDRQPELGLTLAPTPETMEALSVSPRDEDRSTLDTLVRATRARQLLAGTYFPTDLTAMLDAGLEGELAAQLTAGTDTLRRIFDVNPTLNVRLVDERLSDAALMYLQDQQVDRLVVPEGLLEPVHRNTTLAEAFELQPRSPGPGRAATRTRAATGDAGFAAHFAARSPALAAHALLADLAVVYLDSPGARRGVVFAPGRSWQPSGAFADQLLDGLASSPILAAVTVDQLFETLPLATVQAPPNGRPARPAGSDRVLRRRVAAPSGTATARGLPAFDIRNGRRRLEAFASALDPANPVLARIDRTLLASQSGDLRRRDRARYVNGSLEQIDVELRGIAMPQNRSITMTARDGEIPVTITSTLGYTVRAVLRVESETLDFPAGNSYQLALERRNTTLPIVVRAQASGSFPLSVRLQSPAGDLVLASSRFTVRSTAISGVGTSLSIGAALFLLVWWGNHLRGRRSRRLVPA